MTQNIHTMTTMTQDLVNCLTMTRNKVLGLFIFLNFILFSANLVPKLESALFKMKLDTMEYSRLLIVRSIGATSWTDRNTGKKEPSMAHYTYISRKNV